MGGLSEGAVGAGTARRTDLRARSERWARRAWDGDPGPGLSLAASAYGAAVDLRNLAHEAGLARRERVPVPVLSVGGIAVGGSGKTPVAARAARWVRSAGGRPAVVTAGFADELAVHRSLGGPRVRVVGAEDRVLGVRRAVRQGADFVVLDDGFQHRRLDRDVEWAVVAEARLRGAGWRRLPAGPGRDRWSELARADAVVVTRRAGLSPGADGAPAPAAERVGRQFPRAAVAVCELRPGPLRPVNRRAAEAEQPRPRVAFASIMRGGEFLDALRSRCPEIRREFLFPDHRSVPGRRLEEMVRAAGEAGLVGTRKDVVKVRRRVDERTPVWMAPESLSWRRGAGLLKRQVSGLGGLG